MQELVTAPDDFFKALLLDPLKSNRAAGQESAFLFVRGLKPGLHLGPGKHSLSEARYIPRPFQENILLGGGCAAKPEKLPSDLNICTMLYVHALTV